MNTIRIIAVVLFMLLTIVTLYAVLKHNRKEIIWLCFAFSFFTFVLSFSDRAGEFAAELLGNKLSAKFDEMNRNQNEFKTETIKKQDKIESDQKQLAQVVDKILKIMELEKNKPKPMILWGPKADKEAKEYEDTIKTEKKELKEIAK